MARMSWQPAIRAGSCDCSHRKNELIAARRWLRVEMLLCRPAASQFRNPVMAAASMWSRVSLSGAMDRPSLKKAISSRKVSREDAIVFGEQQRIQARWEVRKRRRKTAKSVATARPWRDGRDDIPEGMLDPGDDVRVGLGGQPQVVVGVGDRGVAHVGLQDRQ